MQKVPDAEPVAVELDGPADKPAWKVEVADADGTARTVRVDAVTGTAWMRPAPTATRTPTTSGSWPTC